MSESKRSEIVTDEHLKYLDGLRESGVTNMFGAGEYVEAEAAFWTNTGQDGDIKSGLQWTSFEVYKISP